MRTHVIPVLAAVMVCVAAAVVLSISGPFVASARAQTPAVGSAEQDRAAPQPAPETVARELVNVAAAEAEGVSRPVLNMALDAVRCAVNAGDIAMPPTLTLIDYSLPSTQQRLWVFDLRTGEIRFHELVAHGKGTGENYAQHFSDDMNSHQSSLGLFVTRGTYIGNNGYSLRLDGLEPGFNSRARERAIVMHGAAYVDSGFAAKQGRLGRSWGCPALREAVARRVIDFVRDGGVIFSYYPDPAWLQRSRYLHCGAPSTPDRVVATH